MVYPRKYDPKKHPEQLIAIFTKGGDVADFCAPNDISRRAFQNWLQEYPEFEEAYQVAKMKAELWLNEKGRKGMTQGKDFNATVWSILMRNRCRISEHRTVPIDFASCKTSNQKVELLDREIAAGTLTTAEAKHLAEYIKACAEVNEKTEVAKQVDELMKLAGKG